jgi:hypothetical protein
MGTPAFDASFADAELSPLPSGSRVAVLWLLGSLCPITRAHVLSLTEGRALLTGKPLERPLPLIAPGSPAPPRRAAACLALVRVNPDCFVDAKFERLREAPVCLKAEDRAALASAALVKHASWARVLHPGGPGFMQALGELEARHRSLEFAPYEVSGADDCLKYRKWRRPFARGWSLYVPLRSPDPCDALTVALVDAMQADAAYRRGAPEFAGPAGDLKDTSMPAPSLPLSLGTPPHVVIGPGLPPYSSTEARAALRVGDTVALHALLPDEVASWLLAQRHESC